MRLRQEDGSLVYLKRVLVTASGHNGARCYNCFLLAADLVAIHGFHSDVKGDRKQAGRGTSASI